MAEALLNINSGVLIFKSRSREWQLDNKTLVMGILNVTPDSFSDGNEYVDKDVAVGRAMEMVEDGADIIDIGGESSRPNAKSVSLDEELKRVIPVVEELSKRNIVVSVDTTKAEVARQAIEAGAEIINDISAMTVDEDMANVVSTSGVGVVLMHMRGTPQTMQSDTSYGDIVEEVSSYLEERLKFALSMGIERDKIALDPGIGFGKSVEGNLKLIKNLKEFSKLGCPVMLGASRKSFIGSVTDLDISERLNPSVASAVVGVLNGASIVRVHDVRESKEAVSIANAIKNS